MYLEAMKSAQARRVRVEGASHCVGGPYWGMLSSWEKIVISQDKGGRQLQHSSPSRKEEEEETLSMNITLLWRAQDANSLL